MIKKILTASDLSQFIGTTVWYRHGFVKSITFTDGVKYVADTGGAYWLIDEIVFAQTMPEIASAKFQLWRLMVSLKYVGLLTCLDGSNNPIFAKKIKYTDFPLTEIKFYFTDNVIMLPSEY